MLTKADFENEIATSVANGQSLKWMASSLTTSSQDWASEVLLGLLKGGYGPKAQSETALALATGFFFDRGGLRGVKSFAFHCMVYDRTNLLLDVIEMGMPESVSAYLKENPGFAGSIEDSKATTDDGRWMDLLVSRYNEKYGAERKLHFPMFIQCHEDHPSARALANALGSKDPGHKGIDLLTKPVARAFVIDAVMRKRLSESSSQHDVESSSTPANSQLRTLRAGI